MWFGGGLIPEEAIEAWVDLYNTITSSGAKVVALEIVPVTVDHERVEKIKATNRGLHELGEKYNFPVVDLYDVLADSTGKGLEKTYDSGNGEHLSVEGYKKVGETVYSAFIDQLLSK